MENKKKDFKEIKISACLMVHTSIYAQRTLDNLFELIGNNIYVNLNDASQKNIKIVESHPGVKAIIVTDNKPSGWRQGYQRELTLRMVDNEQPDLVLFPDDDELYYNDIRDLLKDFWESERMVLFFTLDYFWNNESSIRKDGRFSHIHHVRVFKWQPGIVYYPHPPAKACPRTFFEWKYFYYDQKRAHMKHLGYMSEADREEKFKRDNKPHYLTKPTKIIRV